MYVHHLNMASLPVFVLLAIAVSLALRGACRRGGFPAILLLAGLAVWGVHRIGHSDPATGARAAATSEQARQQAAARVEAWQAHAGALRAQAEARAQHQARLAQAQVRALQWKLKSNFAPSNEDVFGEGAAAPPEAQQPAPPRAPAAPRHGAAVAAASAAGQPMVSDGRPAVWLVMAICVALVALALAGVLATRAASGRAGTGLGWAAAASALLILLGALFFQRGPRPRRETLESRGSSAGPAADVASRASIDAIWERLNRPQIQLELDPVQLNGAVQRGESALVERRAEPPEPAEKTADPPSHQFSPGQIRRLQEAAQVLQMAAKQMDSEQSKRRLLVMADVLVKAAAAPVKDGATPVKDAATPVKDAATPTAPAAASTPVPATAAAPPALAPPAAQSYAPAVPAPAQLAQQPTPGELPRRALRTRTPDWVTKPPGLVGEVRKVVVKAGPYQTLEECHRDLEAQMRAVVAERIDELAAGDEGRTTPAALMELGIGTDDILRELCTDEFVEMQEFDFGDMRTAYALLEFAPAQDRELVERWTAHARRAGVERTLFGAAAAVGCLALAFGLLKLDTWTRGYYTKRLFLGVPAAIIAVVLLIMA